MDLNLRRLVYASQKREYERVTHAPAPEGIVDIDDVNEPRIDYDETGRILQFSTCPLGVTLRHMEEGRRCLPYAGRPWADWVDTSSGKPVIAERPAVALMPSTLTPKPMQEVVIPDVPACTVYFQGPVNGEQIHDGNGVLEIGWTTPGTYLLMFDCFPSIIPDLTLTVKL